MFYNDPKHVQKGVSFEDCPSLINPQYQHRTLGEMVALYKLSGEFPAVGMRNGVYYATDIDAEIPTTRDKFMDIDRLRSNLDETAEVERETSEKIRKATEDEKRKQIQELETLRIEKKKRDAQSTSE